MGGVVWRGEGAVKPRPVHCTGQRLLGIAKGLRRTVVQWESRRKRLEGGVEGWRLVKWAGYSSLRFISLVWGTEKQFLQQSGASSLGLVAENETKGGSKGKAASCDAE